MTDNKTLLNGTLEYSSDMFVACQVEEILSTIYKEIAESSLFKSAEINLSGQKVEFTLVDGSPHLPYVNLRLQFALGPSHKQLDAFVDALQEVVSDHLPGGMILPVFLLPSYVSSVN